MQRFTSGQAPPQVRCQNTIKDADDPPSEKNDGKHKITEDNDNLLPEQHRHRKAPTIWRQRSGDFDSEIKGIVLSITIRHHWQ